MSYRFFAVSPGIGARAGFGAFLGFAFFTLAGCPTSTGPVHVDLMYQIVCPSTTSTCPRDGVQRNFLGDDGDANVAEAIDQGTLNASCSLTTVNDSYYFDADISVGSNRFEIKNAQTGMNGGTVGGGCSIRVVDDSNIFVGACASTPTASTPCIVSALEIQDTADGPEVSTTIICSEFALEADPTYKRDLEYGIGMPDETAAQLTLRNCDGL